MKRTLLITSLVLLLAVYVCAQGATPNFSGKWNLDAAKSDFGPAPPPESVVHVVEHKEPNLKVTTTQKTQAGETTNERNLTTDGKENTNKMRSPACEQEVKSTSKWDGKKLVSQLKLQLQGTDIDIKDSWELSEDGKLLTITRDLKTPQGDFSQKTVFNKQ